MSGQIMPFLLVIIAIFLGAFISVANIGQVAMNNTCNDNAADACAMAAASNMALILNYIHKDEMDTYKPNYDDFKADITANSMEENMELLAIKNLLKAVNADIFVAIALGGAGPYCEVWNSNVSSASLLSAAHDLIDGQLDQAIFMAWLTAYKMRMNTFEFKNNNSLTFCSRLDMLNDTYIKAKTDGVKYALENNCVYPNLSADQQDQIQQQIEDQEQQDDNQQAAADHNQPPPPDPPWVTGLPTDPDTGEPAYVDPPSLPGQDTRDTQYAWQDSDGNDHGMGAKVRLPKISSFELEVTNMNEPCGPKFNFIAPDPFGDENLNIMRKLLADIVPELSDLSDEENDIYIASYNGTYCHEIPLIGWECCPWDFWGLDTRAEAVVKSLTKIRMFLQDFERLVDDLIVNNEHIPKDLAPPTSGPRIVSSKGCNDVGNVIILGVKDVKFDSGCIGCDVNMSNAGGSSSGTAMSSFGRGTFSADQPDQHYVPGLVNGENGCPSDTGLTTGTTTDFSHEDSTCVM